MKVVAFSERGHSQGVTKKSGAQMHYRTCENPRGIAAGGRADDAPGDPTGSCTGRAKPGQCLQGP